MKITIDERVLEKYGLTLEEFLFWYLCMRGYNIDNIKEKLIEKNLASKDLFKDFNVILSDNQKDLVASILIDSSLSKDENLDFEDIAEAMREAYPSGIKPGTNYYWRGSKTEIIEKLKAIKSKYKNFKFTKEEAVEATQRYVKSYENKDNTTMHLLKYFILKKDKVTGDVKSEFMSYVENKGEADTINNDDWQTRLV